MVDYFPQPDIFNLMVDISPPRLDAVFGALADPTRRAMLHELAIKPCSVGELAAPFRISLAGASKHVQVLERAGLLKREIQGRVHLCRIDVAPLRAGAEWIKHYERFWSQRLDSLERLLEAEDDGRHRPKKNAVRKAPRR